jgi:hypothetical protein
VWICDDAGLPCFKIEIGIACRGFLVFHPDGSPDEFCNVDMVTSGDWCMEDQLIAIWLRFRREGWSFVKSCCRSEIRKKDARRVMARTIHL